MLIINYKLFEFLQISTKIDSKCPISTICYFTYIFKIITELHVVFLGITFSRFLEFNCFVFLGLTERGSGDSEYRTSLRQKKILWNLRFHKRLWVRTIQPRTSWRIRWPPLRWSRCRRIRGSCGWPSSSTPCRQSPGVCRAVKHDW